jgi:hypothetical protein
LTEIGFGPSLGWHRLAGADFKINGIVAGEKLNQRRRINGELIDGLIGILPVPVLAHSSASASLLGTKFWKKIEKKSAIRTEIWEISTHFQREKFHVKCRGGKEPSNY